MNSKWHVSVLIPARNEELLLERCLKSVMAAGSFLSQSATVNVVVAVDHSTDRTREIAERLVPRYGEVVFTEAGIVGHARACAADAALRHYCGPYNLLWLANTDADSFVPKGWLADQLLLAGIGYEAIAGIIDIDSFSEHDAFVPQRFRDTYLLSPDGSHPHVHGTNFGVRADAYLRAGGWKKIDTAEDHDLWDRLEHVGAKRISPVHLKVTTSGRRIGRARDGFADRLAAHNGTAA